MDGLVIRRLFMTQKDKGVNKMDMELLRGWLIQKGISPNELDSVKPAPIAEDVVKLKEKSTFFEEENVNTMVAVAEVYEKNITLELENVQLKEDNLASMDAIAQLYEMLLGGM